MAKDIIITPASGLVDFQGTVGVSSAVIQLDDNGNLNINSTSGDVKLGNTSSDIYVGDGVANVDIVFEQDGEIRGLTGKTVTLGQTDSYIKINAGLKDTNNQVGTATSILVSTGTGVSWTNLPQVESISATNDTSATTHYPVFVAGTGEQTARIRTTSVAFSYVPSTGTVTATDFNAASDLKLKKNIKLIEDALNKVKQLNGVTFDWIETNKSSLGIIAQDLEKIFPQLVSNVNEEKVINYNGIIALLIESIKELNEKIEKLENNWIKEYANDAST